MKYAMNEWQGRFRRGIGGALMIAVFIATTGYADEIALKGSVRLRDDDHVVRLGHIAELTGPFAQRLADTPIAEAPQGNAVLFSLGEPPAHILGPGMVRSEVVDR